MLRIAQYASVAIVYLFMVLLFALAVVEGSVILLVASLALLAVVIRCHPDAV